MFLNKNPVLDGYHIESELDDFLKKGSYESPLGSNNVNWFANEVLKLEKKIAFFIGNTKEDIIMTKEREEGFKSNNICRFPEKEMISDNVRDHCHLTGNCRGPAHSICNINVTQQQSKIVPFICHNFGDYDCQMFFKRLVDIKK